MIDRHGLPGYSVGIGSKGCVTFADETITDFATFKQHQDAELAELAWLYNLNRGIFMTPGREEEWTLSIAHTDEAADAYVAVFEELAQRPDRVGGADQRHGVARRAPERAGGTPRRRLARADRSSARARPRKRGALLAPRGRARRFRVARSASSRARAPARRWSRSTAWTPRTSTAGWAEAWPGSSR